MKTFSCSLFAWGTGKACTNSGIAGWRRDRKPGDLGLARSGGDAQGECALEASEDESLRVGTNKL